jgi:hypothetical protein
MNLQSQKQHLLNDDRIDVLMASREH